ncbi:MAG: NlpC/P60 family protein [Pseudomonadota bacterium]
MSERHWAERYIGIPYTEADCAALCAQVAAERFGLALPEPARCNSRGARDQQLAAALVEYLTPADSPADGHPVVMQQGRLSHVGLYCAIGDRGFVLHTLQTAGAAVITPIQRLERDGLTVTGHFRWSI